MFAARTRALKILHTAVDLCLIALAGWAAFLLRFEFDVPLFYESHLQTALCVWVVMKLAVFHWYRLNQRSWRFFSVADAVELLKANATGAMLSLPLVLLCAPAGFPRSVPILDWLLCSLFVALRYLMPRLALEWRKRHSDEGREVLIYGAGSAGVALMLELRSNPALGYIVRGFIDDDPHLKGIYIHGLQVLGTGSGLQTISARTGIKEVLIAAPSATAEQMYQILQHCQRAHVHFRTVAALGEVMEGKAMATQIRDVDMQDLLARDPVQLDHQLLHDKLDGMVIMVTGAAGSIGSELCRQLARFRPACILAFEVAETPLFHLEREMKEKFPDVLLVPVIGNVQDAGRVDAVVAEWRPSIIFHAAAYKHVPIMESSIIEAVWNNVFGTYHVARAAAEFGVGEFVLISSDKAVRPTSVMGATKRLCELILRGLPQGATRFVSVRFGNVLGSNGSVIPVFKEQIARGGPVTVTHPEMKRYFMTIPEASQLVLQASAMGRGGEIFVLDMGHQVKIVDVARKLILLSGFAPDTEIKIEFTGVRPGEKLYEELNLDDEMTVPTSHRKIKIFTGGGASTASIDRLEYLRQLCDERDSGGVVRLIQELVPEYTPSDVARSVPALKPEKGRRPAPALVRAAAAAAGGRR